MGRKKKDEDDEGIGFVPDAWMTWIETVPQEERQKVGELLGQTDFSTPAGVTALMVSLVVASVQGSVHPVVVASIQPLLRMMTANVWMMHHRSGTPQLMQASVVSMLTEIKDRARLEVKPLEATYTSIREADMLDVIDADDETLNVVGG